MAQQAAKQAFQNFQMPGKGFFGGAGALLGMGALAFGVNSSLYNGKGLMGLCK